MGGGTMETKRLKGGEEGRGGESEGKRREAPERETDSTVLQRREKQIEYGKNNLSYDAYVERIPRNLRRAHHPKTPKKDLKYSRRQWDGLIKAWKKRIHAFDPEKETPLAPEEVNRKRKWRDWSSSNSRASSSLSSKAPSDVLSHPPSENEEGPDP